MNLTSSSLNGWHAIHVDGQVDSKTVTTLRDYIDAEVNEAIPLALDLTAVPFMSSAGLRTLLTLHRRTQELQVDLALVGLSDAIAETMRVTGFYDFFVIYADLQSLPSRG
jgi:anti-sigma B factor antagonist